MASIRRFEKFLIGGALTGAGYALVHAAPSVTNADLILPMSGGGSIMLIVGIRFIWIGWKKSRDEADERRGPPSIR